MNRRDRIKGEHCCSTSSQLDPLLLVSSSKKPLQGFRGQIDWLEESARQLFQLLISNPSHPLSPPSPNFPTAPVGEWAWLLGFGFIYVCQRLVKCNGNTSWGWAEEVRRIRLNRWFFHLAVYMHYVLLHLIAQDCSRRSIWVQLCALVLRCLCSRFPYNNTKDPWLLKWHGRCMYNWSLVQSHLFTIHFRLHILIMLGSKGPHTAIMVSGHLIMISDF